MQQLNIHISWPLFILLFLFQSGCNTVVTHDGCYVVDPHVNGTYDGECKDGKANGFGKSAGEDAYEGYFVDGKFQGTGKYTWKDGDTYAGQFHNGKPHGYGVLIKGKKRQEGIWEKGELIEEKRAINKANFKF